ncbi:hypothetical protein O181_037008 [Austropuccinia psidii MF-1]|uniref:Uncharacterized protein n=1 Tax=Austropuccinia psidii MF-1 TaxID=1389203 RepID=A0A9Q3DAJ6_9BASI|nr:hypothetical protein [Austropuccinia psidii MF-1]
MHPVLKVAGVVHIWHYLPLCTIFAQQFNGEIFRTKFHYSKINVPTYNTHFEGGLFSSSVWQSMAAIKRLFKDPNHLALQELGWQFNSGLLKVPFLTGITSFQSVFKAESTSASLGKFNWSIQVILKYPVWPWANSFPLCQFSPTVQFSRCPELYWSNSDNTASDSPSRISPSAFHIYWPPFIT